jgi:hypothetical protein
MLPWIAAGMNADRGDEDRIATGLSRSHEEASTFVADASPD